MAEDPSASNRALSARISKLERAAEGHERNAGDLARAQTGTLETYKALSGRVDRLEEDRHERQVSEAAAHVEDTQLKKDVAKILVFMDDMQKDNILGKVKDMSAGFNRLFWLVIAAVITGGIGLLFMALRGGL